MKSNLDFSISKASKILFFFILSVFYLTDAEAQKVNSTGPGKTTVYGDFGGGITRGLVSLNLERKLSSSKNLSWYARGGVGGGGLDETTEGPGFLGGITMLTGMGNNHLELNGGVFIGRNSDFVDELFYMPIADIGYRYQKPEGGIIFKTGVGFLGIRFGLGYAF